jgi:hypothetical protein
MEVDKGNRLMLPINRVKSLLFQCKYMIIIELMYPHWALRTNIAILISLLFNIFVSDPWIAVSNSKRQ